MGLLFEKNDSFVDFVSMKSGAIGDIPTAAELTGLELRLSRVLIIDNHMIKIPPFPGLAEMYLLVIVVSDTGATIQNIDLKGFAKVDDNEELPIDKTIFYWKKVADSDKLPGQIHTFVSVIKSKERLRNVGSVLAAAKADSDYSNVVSAIKAMMKNATPLGQVTDLVFSLAGIIGKYLGKVKDKPLFTWVQSYTDLNDDFNTLGKTTKDKQNDSVSVALSLIVRDKNREQQVLDAQSPEVREELLNQIE